MFRQIRRHSSLPHHLSTSPVASLPTCTEAVLQMAVSRDLILYLLIRLQVFRSCCKDVKFPSVRKLRRLGECKDAFGSLRIADSSTVCAARWLWHDTCRCVVK